MNLSPDADRAQVREAVLYLLEAHTELTERLEEAERRIELISNALKSTLTHAVPRVTTAPHMTYEHPKLEDREPKPVGDGAKYWTNEQGFTVPTDSIPEEFRLQWQRPPGTPRLEYEEE